MITSLLTYNELTERIGKLERSYGFVKTGYFGESCCGRKLPYFTVGEGRKSVLYVASVHASEWMTSELILRFAEDYCETVSAGGRFFGNDARAIFRMRRAVIVPMLNPDGAELCIRFEDAANPVMEELRKLSGGDFTHWQANGRGVDLNHNFDAGFDKYKLIEAENGFGRPGAGKFSGESAESEPETAALCKMIRDDPPDLLLALHTQGREIYCDFDGYVPPHGAAIAARMSRISGYRVAKPEGDAAYGGMKDWFIKEFDRPGFTVECGKGENPLPPEMTGSVYAETARMLAAMLTM